MANTALQFTRAGGVERAGIAAAVLALGIFGLTEGAAAQQAAPKKAPEKAPAAAQKGGQPAAGAPQSAWVKLCEKATATTKTKDGKEEKKDLNICLTHHERLDGNTGMILVSAALRQVDSSDKQHFMVMVPLGMMLQPGMRATIFPKDMWEKIQKNEKVDESKLKGIALAYTLCHPGGCTAETEAKPDLINDLKTSGGLMVFAINAAGAPVAFPVPLNGFEQSYAGQPVDSAKYSEARKQLMQQIAQRQQQLIQEYQKQNAELQKMQGPDAYKKDGAAAQAPAKAAPAQKK